MERIICHLPGDIAMGVGIGLGLALVAVVLVGLVLAFEFVHRKFFPCVLVLGLALVGGELHQLGAVEPHDPRLSVDVPRHLRELYRNPDGSCVQCSEGMLGIDQNYPQASTLLWDSQYGPAERGGSGPERVAAYAKRRGMKVHNITGRPVYDWLKWAVRNGRGAALTCGAYHMQTLMGHDEKAGLWFVCNNNSPERIDTYDTPTLTRLCDASGPWCVILDVPPHPARPVYRQWWKQQMDGLQEFSALLRPADPLKPQLVQFQPRELPKPIERPEVNVKEVRRRGDMEQSIGDPIADHPVLNRFGEVMALPANDADRWHIWCLVDSQGKRSQRLLDAWRTSPELRAFAAPGDPGNSWAHFNTYESVDGTQSWRWEKLQVTATPSVFVQPPISRKYGDPATIVFQAVYQDNPAELAVGMRQAILQYLASITPPNRPGEPITAPCPPNGPCPPPFRPQPNPFPQPDEGLRPMPGPLSPLVPPPSPAAPLRTAAWVIVAAAWLVGAFLDVLPLLLLVAVVATAVYVYRRLGSRSRPSPTRRRRPAPKP